ncbi:MAG: phenylalanyl-tRNA synthetase beta chain [Myxococcota bacterium]|jgi:phenylalanyl-tRNA synthetase beta chain
MFISCNWLRRHVDLDGVDLHALGDQLTMSVAELEGVHEVGHGLDGVVVGHVLEVNALEGKKVRQTLVDVGTDVREIICGAPNVAVGQRVPVVLPGTMLGDIEIRVAKVAGVTSHGMIASEKELGLGEDHDGIMVITDEAAPGTKIVDLYPVADTLFEIDNKSLTHRPDLWGHRGIAREVAALLGRPLLPLDVDVAFTDATPIKVSVEDAERCPRYSAVTMDGLSVAPSPKWLQLLLSRVGTRPISNIVDATNFVMLDLGNPLHAFDRREVAGDTIIVRRAKVGESFVTLDGQTRALVEADLLIADGNRGVALAGVMGGENSEIRPDTSSIILESANFDAASVRLTASRLGLRTEASARFEKSLDPHLTETAARLFCKTMVELCPGATVTSALIDVAAPFATPTVIDTNVALIEKRLGLALGEARVVKTLVDLDFGVEVLADGGLRVTVPSYRATKDISIAADLVEEVGRIYGYDNIPPTPPNIALGRPHPNKRKRFERAAKRYLTLAGGMDEMQTYSFDFDPHIARIGAPLDGRLMLANAISAEMPAMRRSVVPGLLQVAEKNTRGFDAIRVFEIGRVFHPTPGALATQPTMLAGLIAKLPASGSPDAGLFFELKGIVEGLAKALGRAIPTLAPGGLEKNPVTSAWAHPVRQARVMWGDTQLGVIAEVHPRVAQALELRQQAAVLEVDLDAIRALPESPPSYAPLARFPSVFRDFAVLVAEAIPAGDVKRAIAEANPDLGVKVDFLSIYRGDGVDAGEKSLAWSVTLRHTDRTLTEPEVRDAETRIWSALESQVQGRPRA